jgi:hypothetical protein
MGGTERQLSAKSKELSALVPRRSLTRRTATGTGDLSVVMEALTLAAGDTTLTAAPTRVK